MCVCFCVLSQLCLCTQGGYLWRNLHSQLAQQRSGRAEVASLFSLVGGEEAGHAASPFMSAVPPTSEGQTRKQVASASRFIRRVQTRAWHLPAHTPGMCVVSLPLGDLDSFSHGTGSIEAVTAPFIEEAKGTKD